MRKLPLSYPPETAPGNRRAERRARELPRVARPRRARPPRRCARVVTTHRSRSRAEGRGRPRVARAETARMRAVYFFLRDERLAGGLPTGRATRAGAVDRRTVSIVGRYRIYHLPVRSRRSSGSSGASSRRDCAPSGVPASPSPSGRALQRSTTGWNANDSCFACLIFENARAPNVDARSHALTSSPPSFLFIFRLSPAPWPPRPSPR
jgi:hypothetical protein